MGESKTKYIVSPWYDGIFFIGSPIIACLFGLFFIEYFSRGYPEKVHIWGNEASLTAVLALTQAHLVVVFFRSHGNPAVFKRFPIRFIVVPIVLFLAIYFSNWVMAIAGFIVVWWDVYHTSQQNFGIARIYDARSGQPLPQARSFEKFVHLAFYACPILAGSYLMAHVGGFAIFNDVQNVFLAKHLPAFIESNAIAIRYSAIFVASSTFIVLVIFEIYRYRGGYKYPFPKFLILCTTLFTSVFAWGFNKFGDAFFIVNLYHSVQYFAIVWSTEQRQEGSIISILKKRYGQIIAFLCFFIPPVLLGVWFEANSSHLAFALLFTCALLHFWYDGFIWSVRRKEV